MHKPVLLKEVIEILSPRPGEQYVDATVNGGGHSEAILRRIGPKGKVLGIDLDCGLIEELKVKKTRLGFQNLELTCDNYANIKHIVAKYNFYPVSGVVFDLGFSSYHIEKSQRGFSFLRNEPLDMRYNPNTNALTAEKIINTWPEEAIENILRKYGEERFSGSISRGIAQARREKDISSTDELVEVIRKSVPRAILRKRIHFATRTFQALRIAVNSELENLEAALRESLDVLEPSGKIAVISFHSLEDRIVKNFFKEKRNYLEILTPKPIVSSFEERRENPRARSAKLRIAQKN